MKHLIILQLLYVISSVLAVKTYSWTYKKNGADWPNLNLGANTKNLCGTENQSPIDLSYSKFKKIKSDGYIKNYQNVLKATVEYHAHGTIQVTTDKSYFTSTFAKETLGANKKFQSVQFHFHAGSEHTIDGKRYDLEMHTVHYPPKVESGVIAAALGIIFDTKNYDKSVTPEQVEVIDRFFDNMKWNQFSQTPVADLDVNPIVSEINYGELVNNLNTSYRWVYSGSVTTPPCAKAVYWNVIATVMPIKERHLKLFKDVITKKSPNYVGSTGNYRVICKLDKQDPKLMIPESPVTQTQKSQQIDKATNEKTQKTEQKQSSQPVNRANKSSPKRQVNIKYKKPSEKNSNTASTVISVILFVLVVSSFVVIIYLQKQNQKGEAAIRMMDQNKRKNMEQEDKEFKTEVKNRSKDYMEAKGQTEHQRSMSAQPMLHEEKVNIGPADSPGKVNDSFDFSENSINDDPKSNRQLEGKNETQEDVLQVKDQNYQHVMDKVGQTETKVQAMNDDVKEMGKDFKEMKKQMTQISQLLNKDQ